MKTTHLRTLTNNHIYSNLAITPDNKYLLYTSGALFAGDAMASNGETTFGVIKCSDLSNASNVLVY